MDSQDIPDTLGRLGMPGTEAVAGMEDTVVAWQVVVHIQLEADPVEDPSSCTDCMTSASAYCRRSSDMVPADLQTTQATKTIN